MSRGLWRKSRERELAFVGKRLSTKVILPLSSGYRPDLDSTPELELKTCELLLDSHLSVALV
jgi:hypothetical protein